MRCEQELCGHWTGYGCACAVFGIERPHHVEMWNDGTDEWGWQCFTCGRARGGMSSLGEAERGADQHVASTS